MNQQILELIDEQKSPLFRIMSITNGNDPTRRAFDNNISAFHIGNGFILSVAHNLRTDAQVVKAIDEQAFQNDLLRLCDNTEKALLLKCYLLDAGTNNRNINITDNNDIQPLINLFKKIGYDTRWVTLYSKGFCKPHLIVQFKDNLFYNDAATTALFNPNHIFPEPALDTNTFIVELELVEAFYSEDIAVYKMVNTDPSIIAKVPFAKVNFDVQQLSDRIYCLQSSPSGTNMGRLFNEAKIEGLLNQHSVQQDLIGGNIFFSGLRYFLKCYFRFGSSGAPYFVYNQQSETFEVNGVQSEASPIQLLINNNMDGNSQYINAIASPLKIVEDRLRAIIN